jgi:hypothetical protein
MVTNDEEAMRAVSLYHDLHWPGHAMPGPGGMLDQPYSFLQAMAHVRGVDARYRKELEEKAKAGAVNCNG